MAIGIGAGPGVGALVSERTSVAGVSIGTNRKGAKGDTGDTGSTWYTGAGVPSSGSGVDGDLYLRDSGAVYRKASGAWTVVANIKGATGDQGAQGIPGPVVPVSGLEDVDDDAVPTNLFALIGDGTEFKSRLLEQSDITGLSSSLALKSDATHMQPRQYGGLGVNTSAMGPGVLQFAGDSSFSVGTIGSAYISDLSLSKITTGTMETAGVDGDTDFTVASGLSGFEQSSGANSSFARFRPSQLNFSVDYGTDHGGFGTQPGYTYLESSDASNSNSIAITPSTTTFAKDLVLGTACKIDWGTGAGTGTVSATSAQIVRTSDSLTLNVPGANRFSLGVNGSEMIGNVGSALYLSVPTGGLLYLNANNVVGSIAQFDINRWICPTVIRFSAAGTPGATKVEIYGNGASGSMFLNVPTGQTISTNVNGVTQQTFSVSGIQFNTAAGTVVAATRGIYQLSTGLTYNVPTGTKHNLAVNGVIQQTFGINGILFPVGTNTLVSATAGLSNLGIGLSLNDPATLNFLIAGNYIQTLSAGNTSMSVPILWGITTLALGVTESGMARRGAQQIEIGYRSGHSLAISCATVVQQTFTIDGMAFNTAAGTVGTTVRGLYTLSTGLALNVETGATVGTYVNGVLQQTQGVNGLTFNTGAGSATAGTRMITPSSSGLVYNVPFSNFHNFGVNGTDVLYVQTAGINVFGLITCSEVIRFTTAAAAPQGNFSEIYINASGTVALNAPTGQSVVTKVNGTTQQTFDINGIKLNTSAGTITAGTRGIYTLAAGLYSNVETGGALYSSINGVAQSTLSASSLLLSSSLTLIGGGPATQFAINCNTINGNDNSSTRINGGGNSSGGRCGSIIIYGNQHAGAGSVSLLPGAVTGGVINLYDITNLIGVIGASAGTWGTDRWALGRYASGTIAAAQAGIYSDSSAIFLNTKTGSTFSVLVNGVTQQTLSVNGIQINTAAGIVAAATRGIYTLSSGFGFNVETGKSHNFQVNGVAQVDFASTLVTCAAVIRLTNTGTPSATQVEIYGDAAGGNFICNVPSTKVQQFRINNVAQQTFDVNGIRISTAAGSVTAATRGIYTISTGLVINAETGTSIATAINGTNVQVQDASNCTLTTNLKLTVAGNSLFVKQGTNSSAGTGTLIAGVLTVPTTAVNTGDLVILSRATPGGLTGELSYTIVNGTSFTVTSIIPGGVLTQTGDTSTFAWFIVKAA